MIPRRILLVIAILALLIAAFVTRGFGLFPKADGPLALYGNVDIREVDLGYRVGGRIDDIMVEEGARVKRGQLLATLDRASIDSSVAQAEAQVAQARAELLKLEHGSRTQDVAQAQARLAAAQAAAADATRDYDRRKPLVEPGAISRDVWDTTVATRDRANAQLAEAQAALSLVRTGPRTEDIEAGRAGLKAAQAARARIGTDLGDTRLLASVDGTVVTRAREPGAIVAPGETVFTLAIDRPLRVRAYVAEGDLSRIAPGMKVTVAADGNGRRYHGTIGYISPRAEFTPKSVETSDLRTDLVYRLRIIVDDPDGALRQGQPVTVEIADAGIAEGGLIAMTGSVAQASGIVKRFGEIAALDGVDIVIAPGKVTGLVGPDGAGKTTLIRILAGLMTPNEGEVSILGGAPAQRLDSIGYMPQRFGLYEDLTVRENLVLYAELRGLAREEQESVFKRLLDFTDLARFQTRPAGKLSGGMKQKLGLACALVSTPPLLLLDEPGVGVDPISRRELWAMVAELTGEGIGVLWSTAYLDEAELCDSVYLLNEGKLIFSGPPADLTNAISDRVIRVTGFADRRRIALTRALDRDDVIDGTLQGRAIRLLIGGGHPVPDAAALDMGPETKVEPTPARFEDGFIEKLGGGPEGTSALAAAYREIPPSDAPAIEARGLTKRFGEFTAAQDVSFTVPRGQAFGLLGPNGAGKSTTFKMLCGLLTPTSGSGSVAGFDLRHSAAQARASLGYMAQKFSLYGDLSVAQNLDFFAGAYDLSRAQGRRAIEQVTEIFELAPFLKRNAGALPLGFKQRLALACAVMHEPSVLFLDEPTSGVDPVMRREFWTHINGLVRRGVTVLVTTHFMDEAEYCDQVTLIYRSRQIASGPPDGLKAQAAKLTNADDPTMEDAFIALIEASDAAREEAEAA